MDTRNKNNEKKSKTKNVAYDFIPLSDYFYFPTWNVSNDIPCCKTPLSGTIKLHIVTRSPMIVRHNDVMENIDGIYFIPATSLKGCIRNVLEIMSFSKLRTQYGKYYEIPHKYDERYDLSECIFGYVNEKGSLKGRLQFSNAFCISHNVRILDPKTVVLGNPFYNTEKKSYAKHLYLDDNEKIKGWKRYPIKKEFKESDDEPRSDTTTTFRAIGKNTEFLAEVNYFNLNEIELGALLCALTFDNHTECCHQIGSGKGLGYGKVSIQILNFNTEDITQYIQSFRSALSNCDTLTNSDLDLRFDKLVSFSSDSNLDKQFIIKRLQDYIERNEYSKAKMWQKRLFVVDKTESERYEQALSFLNDANKEINLQHKEDALIRLKKANVFLNMKSITKRIADLEQAIAIEEYKNEFDKIKSSGYSVDEKIRNYNGLYDSLKKIKTEDVKDEFLLNKVEELKNLILSEYKSYEQANQKILSNSIKNANKMKTLSENLKKWIKRANISNISEDDLLLIKEKVFYIFDLTKPKDRDRLKNSKEFKELISIVGENTFNEWLEKL